MIDGHEIIDWSITRHKTLDIEVVSVPLYARRTVRWTERSHNQNQERTWWQLTKGGYSDGSDLIGTNVTDEGCKLLTALVREHGQISLLMDWLGFPKEEFDGSE